MAVGKIPFATLGNTAAYCFFPTPLSKISIKCYPLTALGMNYSSSLGWNLPFHTYLRCGWAKKQKSLVISPVRNIHFLEFSQTRHPIQCMSTCYGSKKSKKGKFDKTVTILLGLRPLPGLKNLGSFSRNRHF